MKHEPFWRRETCLHEEDEFCPPKQRQQQLRIVRDLFEREVRRTFRDDATNPELTADRSPVWTPIPGICHNLELAHSALSRMLRELTGLSAIQTYDKLKLNHLQIPLKYLQLIEQFLHSLAPDPSTLTPYMGNGSKQFWKWLKQQRKNPDFDRQALAREFNFPSAARFHRAFAFATDQTPREFENLAIRLAIENPNAFKDLIAKFTPNQDEQFFSPKIIDTPMLEAANLNGTIDNPQLTHSALTITAGTGLSGGGAVSLGGSTTLSLGSNLTLGGTTTGTFSGNLTGNVTGSAASFTGNLAEDVSGTQSATVVATVGGASAANISKAAANAVIPPGMAFIPGGTFTMGNVIGDGDITDAAPISVTVSAFYVDINPVTYSQWRTVAIWASAQPVPYVFINNSAGNGPNHPVQTMDWFDSAKWCNARSELAGKTPVYYTDAGFTTVFRSGNTGTTVFANYANKGYRLPTEAEWEKAARGGMNGQRFPWGNSIDRNVANYNSTASPPAYDLGPTGSLAATLPIGSFAVNGYGLNDMAGNVFNWCGDWYATPYTGGTDPHGPAAGLNRVIRGGGCFHDANYCRTARRKTQAPGFGDVDIGFRTVLAQ